MVSKKKLIVGIALIAAAAFTIFRRKGAADASVTEEGETVDVS